MSHQVRDFFPKEMFSLAFQDKRIWQACKNQKRSEGIGASQVLSLCCKLGWKKKGAPDLCLSNQGNLLFPCCTTGIPCSATGNHHSGPHSHYKDTFHNISSNNVKRVNYNKQGELFLFRFNKLYCLSILKTVPQRKLLF